MTLKDRWPDLYKELLNVKDILESHYRDVCEYNFVVENGRLFILGARVGRRNARANILFALQFFQEGKIDLGEAIERIPPESIEDIVKPKIINKASLYFLGRGMSASPGAATGRIALSADIAEELAQSGEEVILLRIEITPQDIDGIFAAKGILTARGGKTSHAAVAARGMEKPCVAGFESMDCDYTQNQVIFSNNLIFNEGDWITINGSDGSVYAGKGELSLKHWSNYPELVLLNHMIECAIITNKIQQSNVGNAWRIRDFFVHSVPISSKYSLKKAIKTKHFKSFVPPKETELKQLRDGLIEIPISDRQYYSPIIMGLIDSLFRTLSASLGLGNHHLFFRPLWDPKSHVSQREMDLVNQFIGFEYFDINRYIPYLIDFSDIRFLIEIELSCEEDGWFLDFTNPNGESLVANSHSMKSYCIFVNGALVEHKDLPIFYNYIRKREYYWQWYETKKISREEIIAFLQNDGGKRISNHDLSLYCAELGLLRNGEVTDTGLSLIGKRKRGKSL